MDIDWHRPDYADIYRDRAAKLGKIRATPGMLHGLFVHYAGSPADFINDWGMTFDPRNADIGLATTVPFILFDRQREFVDWLYAKWRGREDGVVEKSRDMGVSWLCVGFAVWMWTFHPGTVVGFGSRKEEYVDRIGDPKSLFWKARSFIRLLPEDFRPIGYSEQTHAPYMRILNPANGSSIIGEAGVNIGRGNRTTIYFKDESAHYQRADQIDAALSNTANCKIDVSTPNGVGNPFWRKATGGVISKFVFDWREDPRKGAAWYEDQCRKLDPMVVAQEIDRNYEASISDAFIGGDIVSAAMSRGPADIQPIGGLRVGVDPARFGNDKTVITFRRGRCLLRQETLSKVDTMHVASTTKNLIASYRETPEQIAVDSIGIGAGVADILRGWYPDVIDRDTRKTTKIVVDVNSSIRMSNGLDYNLRAYMWREMRDWLATASIPRSDDLKVDLTGLKYLFRGGELLLESKEAAKLRGIKSPDHGDSLAMTFAYPTVVAPKQRQRSVSPYTQSDRATGTL